MAASALLTADRLRISYLGPILGQLQHEELAWDRRGSAAKGGTETDFGGSDDACVEPICLGRVKFPSKPSIHFFGQITDALFTCGFSIERQPFSLWRGSHGPCSLLCYVHVPCTIHNSEQIQVLVCL